MDPINQWNSPNQWNSYPNTISLDEIDECVLDVFGHDCFLDGGDRCFWCRRSETGVKMTSNFRHVSRKEPIEVKGYNGPEGVRLLVDAFCRLLEIKETRYDIKILKDYPDPGCDRYEVYLPRYMAGYQLWIEKAHYLELLEMDNQNRFDQHG
jgi:hypothetical protein